MAKCTYHPDKRSTASCPQCKEPICDRCRLNGTSLRCMTCQTIHSKGDASERAKRQFCANHPEIPADVKCIHCRKPHCAACLNGQNKCFKCALAPPSPGPAGPRSKTTSLKGAKTGKLKAPPPKPVPSWTLPAVAAGVLVGGGLAAFFLLRPAPTPEVVAYTGPTGVAIVAPSAKYALRGNQLIKLEVKAPRELEKVELTVDGKYWDDFTQPPFQSDWQTALLKNGRHVIQAQATYKGGKKAKVQRVVITRNKKY